MNSVTAPNASDKPQADPITLEVIRHGIISICDQIDANMTRTAFSPYIYEYKDYAVGFVSAAGDLLAQSTGGMPVFVADSVGGSPVDDDVFSLHVVKLAQTLAERLDAGRVSGKGRTN